MQHVQPQELLVTTITSTPVTDNVTDVVVAPKLTTLSTDSNTYASVS